MHKSFCQQAALLGLQPQAPPSALYGHQRQGGKRCEARKTPTIVGVNSDSTFTSGGQPTIGKEPASKSYSKSNKIKQLARRFPPPSSGAHLVETVVNIEAS